MIDTESVACESCTAPAPGVLDASDAASRAWPRIDIETNPFKAAFPLFTQHPDIAFLDSAATAQRPACVLEAQKRFYETMNANPLRGLYSLSVEATEAIAKVRAQIAGLIGAVDEAGKPRANEVVFTRNTSESLNIVASSFAPTVLGPGDEVAITIMEHHSNLIPWQRACRAAGAKLVYLYPTKTGELTDAEIAEKIGPRTKIVACTQVSNVLGCRVPVEKLARAVHAHGGYLVVDAAQSVPHMPVDVRALGADFLAFSAHKALGPMGVGVLWGRHELLDAMPPFLTGGEMIDSVTEQDAVWAPVPEKFEAGTQDAAGIYATGAALDYLVNQVGYDTVQAREQALVHYAMSRMVELPYVEIIGSIYWDRHHGVISFNVRGGRCEACGGDGQLKIEMHFLPDIYVPCEVCKGKRYNRETLEVHYKGRSIADVLEMTVEEALEFFRDLPKLANKLETLRDVGLGYIKLGQSSTTLSGGEAQRVKLATELSKRATGRTIYILDEPTTGLHTDDVRKLLEVLQKLTDAGNTVLVIEHNLDVIKSADYLIDLGPEGGSGGGTLVACGTPEEVAACEASYTGQYLKKVL